MANKRTEGFFHWLMHKLMWNRGTIETWYSNEGWLMVGFVCDKCGQKGGIDFVYPPYRRPDYENQ